MHHTYRRRRLVCALIVAVFAMVTVFEPITAVAAETGGQNQSSTQSQSSANGTQQQSGDQSQDQQNQQEQAKNQTQGSSQAEKPEAALQEEGTQESGELDYEESANSWRFSHGELIEQPQDQSSNGSMRKSRAANRYIRKGIDVSKHQGKIDWNKVKAAGIDFAIIRCGYGSDQTNQDDAQWAYNVKECERLGIPYGVYLYSYANTMDKAKSEAQHTLRLLKGHRPSYPVYYDLEDKVVAGAGTSAIVNMANTYCSTLENAGYKAGIYASKSWWTSYLSSSSLNKYEKWVAQWNSTCTYTGSYRLWQYTSDGSVPGISGRVDMNYELGRSDTDTYMGSWKASGGKYYFYNFQGTLLKSQWITYQSHEYYLDADGARVTGAQTIDGTMYYFESDGMLKSSCWVKIDGEKYYVDAEGVVQKGHCDEIKVSAPTITKWTRTSATAMKLTWKKNEAEADGYEIQYSKASDFAADQTEAVKVESPDTLSKTISKLEKNKKYYVQIRTFVKSAGQVYYSSWVKYTNTKTDKTAAISLLKKAGKTFELNSTAGQKTGQYDVVQGSCTDGTNAYYILYNKSNERCRILKSRMSDNATVKLSGVLNLNHGNDVTYNSDLKKLVVVHYSGSPYRLSLIDPNSLTVTSYKDVKIPTSLEGASASTLAGIQGFSAVAYNSERHQYVVRLIKSHNYLLLDENMTPVKYVTVSKAGGNLNQGIDASSDYIYDVQSKAGSYNTVIAYDWDGMYQYTAKIPTKYEMESLFHSGDKFYAATYSSYYQTYYTTHYKTKKVRWKKVRGKWKYKTKYVYKTVKYKVKWKKVRGKWKYKTKKKKVRVTYQVAHKRLVRNNYVYNVGSL